MDGKANKPEESGTATSPEDNAMHRRKTMHPPQPSGEALFFRHCGGNLAHLNYDSKQFFLNNLRLILLPKRDPNMIPFFQSGLPPGSKKMRARN